MTLLEISQIILNFTVAFAALIVGVLASIFLLLLIQLVLSGKKLFHYIYQESIHIKGRVNDMIDGFMTIPVVARLLKKRRSSK